MATGTALVFDDEMSRYKLLWKDAACEVEVPERLTVCCEALQSHGLMQRCTRVPVREATEQEILLAHSREYLEAVKETTNMTVEQLMEFSRNYNDVYFHPNIYGCAKLAVGGVLQLVDAVMRNDVRNGMALVRPPGHHALHSAACGFCVFNNVAIAALYAKKKFNLSRILIVDWDVHHGQGVQFCFEDDPSVLYFSWHRYEHQTFWPKLAESDYTSTGKGKGSGFNINLPWNKVGMTDSDYLAAFFHLLLPVAYQFDPELVLVSAGFDSAVGDPEVGESAASSSAGLTSALLKGEMAASPEVFAHLTQLLLPLAAGKICLVLEGGYNLTSLAQSVCQTVQTLLGDPAPRLSGLQAPCESALESLQNIRQILSTPWSCFNHCGASSETSRKKRRLEEKSTEADNDEKRKTEEKQQGVFRPEPLHRPSMDVQTLVSPPSGLEMKLTNGCRRLSSKSPQRITEDTRRVRDEHFQDVTDENVPECFGKIFSVLDEIQSGTVCNGCVAVKNLDVSVRSVFHHALTTQTERVLVVFIGDGDVPVVSSEGKVFLIQVCCKEVKEKSGSHVTMCLSEEGGAFHAGLIQALMRVILPLAYELDPGLVLGVMEEGGARSSLVPAWGHMISLLRGVAQARALVLLQSPDKDLMELTAAALSGAPVSPLRTLGAPKPQDVEMLEKKVRSLQKRWGLLRCAVSEHQQEN